MLIAAWKASWMALVSFPAPRASSDGHGVESFPEKGSCLRGLHAGGVDARYDRNGNGSFDSQSSSFFG